MYTSSKKLKALVIHIGPKQYYSTVLHVSAINQPEA